MRPVVKRWVDALRSGEYKQGRNFLERDGKFCCLGVLCEIEGQEYMKGVCRVLPVTLQNKIGLRNNIGEYSGLDEGFSSLTELNDNHT